MRYLQDILHEVSEEEVGGSSESTETMAVSRTITLRQGLDYNKSEQIFGNFSEVMSSPRQVHHALTDYRGKEKIYSEHDIDFSPFILRDGRLYTYKDLHNPGDFEAVITGDHSTIAASDMIADRDYRYYLLDLLNCHIRSRFYEMDAIQHPNRKHVYFFPVNEGYRLDAVWETSRTSMRWLSKPWNDVYVHKAVEARFRLIGDQPYLVLKPTTTFTKDGYKDIEQKSRNRLSTKFQSYTRNSQYHNNVKFWSATLAHGKNTIQLYDGVVVKAIPANFQMDCSRTEDYRGEGFYEQKSKPIIEREEADHEQS